MRNQIKAMMALADPVQDSALSRFTRAIDAVGEVEFEMGARWKPSASSWRGQSSREIFRKSRVRRISAAIRKGSTANLSMEITASPPVSQVSIPSITRR